MTAPVPAAWPLALPPRPWQPAALAAALAAVRAGEPALVVAPCGSGKSLLIAALVASALPRASAAGDAIVVLTSRQELVRQIAHTLQDVLPGASVGTYFADSKAPDAAVVVAFGQILVKDVLEAPRLGCFNLHGSLLPRWP